MELVAKLTGELAPAKDPRGGGRVAVIILNNQGGELDPRMSGGRPSSGRSLSHAELAFSRVASFSEISLDEGKSRA